MFKSIRLKIMEKFLRLLRKLIELFLFRIVESLRMSYDTVNLYFLD